MHAPECARLAGRDRREKERAQLADLVGKNLTYISQLEGLDYDLYLVRPAGHHVHAAPALRSACTSYAAASPEPSDLLSASQGS